MDKRTDFLKVYANLPLSARSEVVVVVKNEPLTWNSAHLEVEQNTPVGKEILEILTKLEILK